jgi:hypothetical protein
MRNVQDRHNKSLQIRVSGRLWASGKLLDLFARSNRRFLASLRMTTCWSGGTRAGFGVAGEWWATLPFDVSSPPNIPGTLKKNE